MAPSEYVSTCVRPSVRAAQDGLAGARAGGLTRAQPFCIEDHDSALDTVTHRMLPGRLPCRTRAENTSCDIHLLIFLNPERPGARELAGW